MKLLGDGYDFNKLWENISEKQYQEMLDSKKKKKKKKIGPDKEDTTL